MNIATSPINYATATKQMGLMVKLSSRLAGNKDFSSICIKNAITSNMPSTKILETVKDMCEDNPVFMEALLGAELYYKINRP